MVSGDDMRAYATLLNDTNYMFEPPIMKETHSKYSRPEVVNGLIEAHYDFCAEKLGFDHSYRLLIEESISLVLQMGFAFEKVARVEFTDEHRNVILVTDPLPV